MVHRCALVHAALLVHTALLATACPLANAQQIDIALEHFGVGDHARPGDIIGAEFSLKAEVDSSTPVEFVWELPDGNGDIAQISRMLVVNPGQTERVWMYARIPPTPNAGSLLDDIYTVRAWEYRDGARVRQLGAGRVSAQTCTNPIVAVDIESDLIGVVGTGRMGLDVFATPMQGLNWIPSMNVLTQIARGLTPQSLPDQWEGLSGYQALIWSEGDPKAMSSDVANALREWIFRGGNFVIVLPEVADPWGVSTPAKHALTDLMPAWKVVRDGAVPVTSVLPLVSRTSKLLNPKATISVAFFEAAPTKSPYQAQLLMPVARDSRTGLPVPRPDSHDGQAVALSRSYGHGTISVVGIDVDGLFRRALSNEGIPRGDVFWNRILARRADTPSPAEYTMLQRATPTRLVTRGTNSVDLGRGELVNSAIGMVGRAALGILGAFLLFLVYWVCAGPGGFAILKWRGWERHSWVVSTGLAMAFGVTVWAVGSRVGTARARTQHLTVLDSIWRSAQDEPADERIFQRATCWFSVFLPGYSSTTVAVGNSGDNRNVLTSWSPPPGGASSTFPNPAIAAGSVSSPNSMRVTARSTSASFEAQWLGSVSPQWGKMPFGSDAKRPLTQTIVTGDPVRVSLTGLIEHRLPGPLRNVHFIHVTPIRAPLPTAVGNNASAVTEDAQLPNFGRFQIVPSWQPGEPIEIGNVMYPGGAMAMDEREGGLALAIETRYQAPFKVDFFQQQLGGLMASDERERFLDMLGIYSMLQPPAYLTNPPVDVASVRVSRMIGRTMDISQWFTRPSLIVWGYLDAADCPIELLVNGEEVPGDGLVLVRTVFPLDPEVQFAAPTTRKPDR